MKEERMSSHYSFWNKTKHSIRAFFLRKKAEAELDSEFRFHLEAQIEANIRAGMSPDAARQSALREFGGVELAKEECRDERGTQFVEHFWQDLRNGARMLRKNSGFTTVAILTLALGIGANTAIFSLLYSLALRPLPVRDAANVVNVYEEFRGRFSRGTEGSPSLVSYPEYLNYRDHSRVFTGLSAYAPVSMSPSGTTREEVSGLLASCNYFAVLGGEISAGRGFNLDDCHEAGGAPIAVISKAFWENHFGADPSALGKTLMLNKNVLTIVGIAAKDFSGTEMQIPDVWIPVSMAPQIMPNDFPSGDWLASDNLSWLKIVGRLKPGISSRQAEGELAVLAQQNDSTYPGRQTIVTVNSASYWNSPEMRKVGSWVALAVLAVAAFILVIACINLTSLLLARASTRYQEMGVRLALGASKVRLMSQLLTETIMLALAGGTAGLFAAQWLPPLLIKTVVPEVPANPNVDLSTNLTILFYTFLASLVAGIVCGFAPALQSTRLNLVLALKEEGTQTSRGLKSSRLRGLLSIAQMAGCSVLLIGAGLLVRGLHSAESTSPGFLTKNVIVVSFDLANNRYNETRAGIFDREVHDRVAALPGVASVARSAVLPGIDGYLTSVTMPGTPGGAETVWTNIVSSDYFQTLGIPFLKGRVFTQNEAETGRTVPAVISAAMARRFWPGTDPIGKEFVSQKTVYHVFGIVPDAQNSHFGQIDGPFFYAAGGSNSALGARILVRTNGDASALVKAIPQLAAQIDPNVRTSTRTFEQALNAQLAPSRTIALLVAILGLLAMVLAIVGISGTVAYDASKRTREIGVRTALGAQPQDIITMLLRNGVKLALIGLAAGMTLATGASQLLSAASLLYGVSSLDPLTYLTTAMVLAGITMLACYVPARRATRVDPMTALRNE
jgi:predicted permease